MCLVIVSQFAKQPNYYVRKYIKKRCVRLEMWVVTRLLKKLGWLWRSKMSRQPGTQNIFTSCRGNDNWRCESSQSQAAKVMFAARCRTQLLTSLWSLYHFSGPYTVLKILTPYTRSSQGLCRTYTVLYHLMLAFNSTYMVLCRYTASLTDHLTC